MNFISFEFLILLVVVLALLWFFKWPAVRKIILLAASCVFYAWWDYRFLGLLATVTIIDYYVSQFMISTNDPNKRKTLLLISVIINIGFLGFFKYFNFFIDSLNFFAEGLGWRLGTLSIILPIGISFYTFETLSYVIDVYRGIHKPAKSILDYAIFITFFPRLVAGPIMRPSQFLPQLERGIYLCLTNIFEGTQWFMRGLLKKVVVADNCSILVDQIFIAPQLYSSPTVWLAVLAYSIQIYFDFSGYTDMARGIAKMISIELPINFNLPYTAQSITEFWNRWHISLSSWLRDYLYISLGGNRKGKFRTYANLMLTMLLGGLWHGASWNFVVWGGLHGLYLSFERLIFPAKPSKREFTSITAWIRAMIVFLVVTLTWVPFRSPDWNTTLAIFKKLLFFSYPMNFEWYFVWALISIPLVIIGGLIVRRFDWKWPILPFRKPYAVAFIMAEVLTVLLFAPVSTSPFIYFQF